MMIYLFHDMIWPRQITNAKRSMFIKDFADNAISIIYSEETDASKKCIEIHDALCSSNRSVFITLD